MKDPPSPLKLAPPTRRFLPSWLPALQGLAGYTPRTLRADLVAGLTVAAVAIPQSMADASMAGLPPCCGLYTAIVLTAVAALFSASRHVVHGPTTAISIAVMCALTPVPPAEKLAAAVLLAFLVGLIQLACRVLRIADLGRHLSPSVLFGFMLGIVTVLTVNQSRHLLGLSRDGVQNPWALTIGLGTLGLIVGCRAVGKRFRVRLPEFLLAVTVAAGVVATCGLEGRGVAVVGDMPGETLSFCVPAVTWQKVQPLLPSAVAIALLGLFESLAIARMLAERSGQELDVRQQCLSEGLANLAGSFFQCFPGSGSFTRSTLNLEARAATQWAALFSAGVVATALLLFSPLVRFLPRPALAALLIVSAWRLVNRRQLLAYVRQPGWATAEVFVVALAAVAVSIEFAVLAGVVLSVLARLGRPAAAVPGESRRAA
jgi:SulP family sulfate permease